MSGDPARFLNAFAQALAAMALYRLGHPARERALDVAYQQIQDLQAGESRPLFHFLGDEVVFGRLPLRELKAWDWGKRLAQAGIQRLEFEDRVSREDFEGFLEEVVARLTLSAISTEARQMRRSSIRFGAVGLKGETELASEPLPTATISFSLGEEVDTLRWLQREVQTTGAIPLTEAVAGARMLLDVEEDLDLAVLVAYEHHIMINGGGYPVLRYARDCHPASKLVHVCDVYDALRTRRPYREAWSFEKTLGYLQERSGLEFDPELCGAFVRMMKQWEGQVAVLSDERTPVGPPAAAKPEQTGV